jgi:large subunit ribosomal protein L4
MATFPLYTTEGTQAGTVERPTFFDVPADANLIHRYFMWVRSLLRNPVAHTKNRGEISGGGKKPWKQKGTGRARVGSSRNPVWRHGGTVFGPRSEQTFAIRMPRSERRKALFSALASKAENNAVIVLESPLATTPSVKAVNELLAKLPIEAGKKILHVEAEYNPVAFNAARNLPHVNTRTISRLNIIDVLHSDVLLLDKETLSKLEQHFTPAV